MAYFKSYGTIITPRDGFLKVFKKNEKETVRVQFNLRSLDKNSTTFLEVLGSMQDSLSFPSMKKGERITVPWKDRLNEDVKAKIPNFAKYSYSRPVTNEDGSTTTLRRDFLTSYDYAKFLENELPNLTDKKLCIGGRYRRNAYISTNGEVKYGNRFEINYITVLKDEDEVGEVTGTTLQLELLYNTNSQVEGEADGDYYLNCYIAEYINKDEKQKYLPISVRYDMRKAYAQLKHLQETGAAQKDIDFLGEYLKNRREYIHDKAPKDGTYVKLLWDIIYRRGAEEVEFTEDMLTDAQRDEILFGQRTLEDFKQKAIGERKEEIRLISPNLTNGYENGVVLTSLKQEDIDAETYVPRNIVATSTNAGNTASKSTIDEFNSYFK